VVATLVLALVLWLVIAVVRCTAAMKTLHGEPR
jgi:hypothetical protein